MKFMISKLSIWGSLALMLCLSARLSAAVGEQTLQGHVTQITSNLVTFEDGRTFKLDLKQSQCFTPRGYKITCETLVAVGYADKAKITIMGNTVQRIDLLDLKQ